MGRKIFLDLGAWVGNSVDLFRRSRKDAGEYVVYAFECDKRNIDWLNRIPNVNVIKDVVWDKDCEIDIRVADNSESTTCVKEKSISKEVRTVKEKAIDFSRWMKEHLREEDYIICKMNIEGAEYRVLQRLIDTGVIFWIDELYVDWHYSKMGMSKEAHDRFVSSLSVKHSKWGYDHKKYVCYTVITGTNYHLNKQIVEDRDWDFICFTNGKNLNPNGWELRYLDDKINEAHLSRKPKILHDDYLVGYDYSLYLDSKFAPNIGINKFVNEFGKCDLCVMDHPRRKCVYKEIDTILDLGYDATAQGKKYRQEGMPGEFGLWAPGIMLRKHRREGLYNFCHRWWEETAKGSHRDIVSLAYCMWKWRNDISYREMDFRRTCNFFRREYANNIAELVPKTN